MIEEAIYKLNLSQSVHGCLAFWVHTADQLRLRVGLWNTDESNIGTILLFPGRTEYLERCDPVAAKFNSLGYTVFSIDWRGHGLSDRICDDHKTCHVNQFSNYQIDVAAMISAAEDLCLPKPWYLVGHSMGACIGLRALIDGLPVTACSFTAPLWDVKLTLIQRSVLWPLTWAAQTLGIGHIYAPTQSPDSYIQTVDFKHNRLSYDPDRFDYWVHQAHEFPDLQIGGPSMGWVHQALNECRSLSTLNSPNIPCLAFCGDQDELVDIHAMQKRMSKWSNGELVLIKNAKHELLSEIPNIRESVMAKIFELFTASGNVT